MTITTDPNDARIAYSLSKNFNDFVKRRER